MRMHSARIAAMALAITASSCSAPAPGEPQAPPAPGTPTGSILVRDATGATGPFRLAGLQRLFLESTYAGVPGPHSMRVDIVAPSGSTFGSLPCDLTADTDGKGAASQRLEVRGTRIHLYHLVGSWRFVLLVDGAPLASASVDVVD